MFIGHFAAGFAAKKIQPTLSLGTLFLAAQFLDLLWPTLLLLGMETVQIVPGITRVTPLDFTSYPISHSLLVVFGWAVLFAFVYRMIWKDTRGAAVLGCLVLSHWVFDLLMHRPDLPLYPGNSPKYGFGIWNSLPVSLVLELLLFGIGILLYLRATTPINNKGRYGIWGLILFLLLIHLGNLFGPAPTDTSSIAWAGQLQWLLVLWGWWADRNRKLQLSSRFS